MTFWRKLPGRERSFCCLAQRALLPKRRQRGLAQKNQRQPTQQQPMITRGCSFAECCSISPISPAKIWWWMVPSWFGISLGEQQFWLQHRPSDAS
mmetsp:Transcript_80132/g.223126  ORF Transcript_80132/g.223126 Transcript_80132/m.223126 type:complete len:95 (-) Transcript_80132:80-364(-)